MWWGFFSPVSLFPGFHHSPALTTVWWANLCSLAPCVHHTFGLHQTCIRYEHIKSSGHQTTDITTTSAAAASASRSSGLFGLTDGRSQLEHVFHSHLLLLLVHINCFGSKQRVFAHHSEREVWCVESALDAWQVLRGKELREWWEVEDGGHHTD